MMQLDYKRDKPLKIFIAYIMTQKKLFLIDMTCALLVSVVDLVFPFVSRISMNELLPSDKFGAFFAVMGAIALAFVLRGFLYYLICKLGHKMGVRVEARLRRDLFSHMQSLSTSFYDKNRTGTLLSRITADLFEMTELAHHGPENIIICTLTILGALCFMFALRWELALTLTVLLFAGMWFTVSQRKRMMEANIEVKKKTGEISAAIESSISGSRTARAFGNEASELEKFDKSNKLFIGSKVDYYNAMSLYISSMDFTTSIMQVAVVAVGGLLIMKGQMNYIDLVTFSLYVSTFTTPIRKLVQFSEAYMQGAAGFKRFMEIMQTDAEVTDAPDASELSDVRGAIDFDGVSFHYSNNIPVLTDIDLHIKPGECLAVVGPSGGGKTTLCQLLPRFYDVTAGSLKIDGVDIRKVTQASLRKNIGMIQQDVFMFAGTIKDNILYGRPDASDDEIIEAAKKAEIHSEIMEMPNGYDSYIGERGVMLSGGQKQRISIARVFLKNPAILILDEATSALDTVTEQKIQSALDALSVGRTTIIIAHRLSTVRNADEIAVIDGEHIIEKGTHDELTALRGEYAKLCEAQKI